MTRAVASDTGADRLAEPLRKVLGTRSANALAKLGLETVGDLLRHYPRRFAEPGAYTQLTDLVEGEHVTLSLQVVRGTIRSMRSRRGAMFEVVATDGSRQIGLTFFAGGTGALRGHERQLVPGQQAMFSGTVKEYRGMLQLTNPKYHLFGAEDDEPDEDDALADATRPEPIYAASAAIESKQIHAALKTVLGPLREEDVEDPVPPELLTAHGLDALVPALRELHLPEDRAAYARAQRRLRYEEALVLQTELARRRAATARLDAVVRPLPAPGSPSLLADFDARLPFELTAGQRAAGAEIAADLARPHPMQRLLQGDVGSGKTVVALRAMLQVIDAGGQAALLAPTEVLAAQHARTLETMLGELAGAGMLGGAERATRVRLLTGSMGAGPRKQALLDAASGAAGIVVGTHVLLGDQVQFAELGLVVVDEQHRFGVEQRDLLRSRARVSPHMLVMTATPIPRTVAMTVFGDLETSMLRELPTGRTPVRTHVVAADKPAWLARTWQLAREQIDAGHRVYVVCPRIDPDSPDELDEGVEAAPEDRLDGGEPRAVRPPLRAVLEVVEELRRLPALAGVHIGALHGRMAPAEKDAAMAEFSSGAAPLLVSTTVVEVGVDVPEATLMIILDADRYGVSQLHQLRGRVGRSDLASTCLLVSSAGERSPAGVRLAKLASTTDGFELARFDLEQRREGDVLGAAQSGLASSLRMLRVLQDAPVIEQARADAERLVAADPELAGHPALRRAIDQLLAQPAAEFLDRA
ncbi:MAG: ATP-dependent DNA helicase RecG [Cellulomonadaceae bacterium]